MGQLIVTPSYDGGITRQYEVTWTAARDAAAGDAIDETSDSQYVQSDTGISCGRFFLTFNLADIPAGATIISALLDFGAGSASCADAAHGTLNLVSATPASQTDYVLEDFDQRGSAAFAAEVDASAVGGGAYTFTLNAAGRAWLAANIGVKTDLCIITKKDFDNTAPTGSGYVVVYSRNYATASLRPTLTVNYEVASPSVSVSLSPSISPSASLSLSPSVSLSLSPSVSVSLSPSLSPSVGYQEYSRGDYAVLPVNDDDLETSYSAQNVTDVTTKNDVRVSQTGTQEYMIHQFKDFGNAGIYGTVECELQSSLAPASSTVYLQIYNQNTSSWETIDSDSSTNTDTDFILTANVPDLTDYKDASNVISCRVYQLAL